MNRLTTSSSTLNVPCSVRSTPQSISLRGFSGAISDSLSMLPAWRGDRPRSLGRVGVRCGGCPYYHRRPMSKQTPVEAAPDEALVWTDGACSGNPGPGGWAAIVVPPGGAEPVELSGGAPDTTNNRVELTAAREGLRPLPDGAAACVVTDSQLMLNSMTAWLPGWKRKGW